MISKEIPMRVRLVSLLVVLSATFSVGLYAQDSNIWLPTDRIEDLFKYQDFEIVQFGDTRFEGDRTQRVTLRFDESTAVLAKWAAAPPGGGSFNNRPAYEAAAYEIQKLFLDEPDFVVPPSVLRAVPLSEYPGTHDHLESTFRRVPTVIVNLSYWMASVTPDGFHDEDRFEADSVYARHFADFNLFTHLIRHNDENAGNYLVSTDQSNPRVFSVDNGLAFGRETSDVGFRYRNLQVDRFPHATVERLRHVTEEDLHATLGVIAQFEERGSRLVQVEPGENLDRNRRVRSKDGVHQFGLTEQEITWLRDRLRKFLEKVDKGDYTVF